MVRYEKEYEVSCARSHCFARMISTRGAYRDPLQPEREAAYTIEAMAMAATRRKRRRRTATILGALRCALGVSQKDFGRSLNLGQQQLSRLEGGLLDEIEIADLAKDVEAATGLPMSVLMRPTASLFERFFATP
jgi:hypothetical protein